MATIPLGDIKDIPHELVPYYNRTWNGKLPSNIRASVAGLDGSATVTMCITPMRSFVAMRAAALEDGVRLRVGFATDSYRPYAVQDRIFHERYTTEYTPGAPKKICNGITYYLVEGATAACPGTSNHGYGLAVDLMLDNMGHVVNWLIAHADEFGFAGELQSEDWHWRYIVGDAIPAATLAYEEGLDMALTSQDVDMIWKSDINSSPTVSRSGASSLLTTEEVVNRIETKQAAQDSAIAALDDKLDQVLALLGQTAPPGGLTKADVQDAAEDAVRDVLSQGIAGSEANG